MSWGYKILIGFTAFVAMMTFMVVRSFGVNFEMVEKDYYKSELRYQEVIDATKNATGLSKPVQIVKSGTTLTLQLPAEVQQKKISGSIWFYNAADASKDKHIELKTNTEGMQELSNAGLQPGSYTVKMQWKADETNYYSEQQLTISQ
ncbi:MAG: FixH family protein [Chitinophagaceae bacterium]|nr:FixH family protein [Chitinophagaceae bacterium]